MIQVSNGIYSDIIDFVLTVKKLEYSLYSQHKDVSTGNIFEEYYHAKTIPRIGELEFEEKLVRYYFHGLGIDFITEQRRYSYNYHGSDKGFGVYFTPQSIYGYDKKLSIEEIHGFEKLVKQNKIKQWMPESPFSQVYYLI